MARYPGYLECAKTARYDFEQKNPEVAAFLDEADHKAAREEAWEADDGSGKSYNAAYAFYTSCATRIDRNTTSVRRTMQSMLLTLLLLLISLYLVL